MARTGDLVLAVDPNDERQRELIAAEQVDAVERRVLRSGGDLGQDVVVLLDQVGTHARQIAFGQAGQLGVQHVRDRQVQHRIAQELQTLVVVGAEAAVRDGLLQQARLAKSVAQANLQFRQCGRNSGCDGHAHLSQKRQCA